MNKKIIVFVAVIVFGLFCLAEYDSYQTRKRTAELEAHTAEQQALLREKVSEIKAMSDRHSRSLQGCEKIVYDTLKTGKKFSAEDINNLCQ